MTEQIKPEDVELSVSFKLLRKSIPLEVIEMERAMQGITGDYPDLTEYSLAVQDWFRKCVGFDFTVSPRLRSDEE